jgi:periplasmic protein TonB
MRKTISITLFLMLAGSIYSQSDTTFFDKDWKECSKKEASFFRLIEKKEKFFIVHDYYMNGQPQMIFQCSSVSPEPINDGPFIMYDQKGNKEIVGAYKGKTEIGTWIWYEKDESDSTVATFNNDGTKNFTHFSKKRLEEEAEGKVYTLADIMPNYPGGIVELQKFLSKNFVLSKNDKQNKICGKFYVSVIVDKSGNLKDPQIINSLSSDCDKEALRVIKIMPKWEPGVIDDKKVRVKYNIEIDVK